MMQSSRNTFRLSTLGFLEEQKDGPHLLVILNTGIIHMKAGEERSPIPKKGDSTA